MGILFMPYGFYKGGLFLSFIVTIIWGIFTYMGYYLLYKAYEWFKLDYQ